MSNSRYSPRNFSPRSQRSQQSPLKQVSPISDDSPKSPPSQPSQQSGSRSKRENSPNSRLSSISSRLRGRISRTKQLPRPPVAEFQPRRSGIVKRGAVTVRFGEVHREAPSDYRVEVHVDDYHIGSTPPCSNWDYQPMWDFTMKMCDLELDAEIVLRIICKRGWPNKDAEVARGVFQLDQASFARNYVEEDVDIFFPSETMPPERMGDDHMAEVRIHIDFDMPTIPTPKVEPKQPSPWQGSGERNGWETQSSGSKPSKPRAFEEDEEDEREQFQPVSLLRDTGAGVALPRSTFKRQQIVDLHYWDPVPTTSSTVLCTPLIVKLLRLDKCIPCWPRRLTRKEEEDEDDA